MTPEEAGVVINHHWFYVKEAFIPAGLSLMQHKHKFDHDSKVISGEAIVSVEGNETMLFTGDIVKIKAHLAHKVTAITDVIWHCIHETDERDPEKIDESLIEN